VDANSTAAWLDCAACECRRLIRYDSFMGFASSVIFFLLLALSAPCSLADQSGCPVTGAPIARIPFRLIGDHIYTEAIVNGEGPYRFIVDTGGVNLIDAGLVRPLSLKIAGTETGHGTGPETVESGETTVEKLALGTASFPSQKFYTFDFQQLYAGGGVKMLGMAGAPLFRPYITCIDFAHNQIELIDKARFDVPRAGVSLPMSIRESEITVRGSFDQVPGVFQIDTGSPTTLTLTAPFVAEHNLLARFPHHVQTSSGGVGGSTPEFMVRGKDLVLGTLRIEHPITALSTATKGNLARTDLSGNIGIGALKRYVVTFDFPGQRLFLKAYEPLPPDLDTYDHSGMRIEAAPSGFRVVSIAEGTPAAEAGLHPGDLIVSVDGKPATSIALPAMREELRQRPSGSVLTLRIKTDDKLRSAHLTLRNLL